MTKTTEEVKYVYQGDGPLLVPKNSNNGVYQETTINNNRSGKTKSCWTGPMFSRIRIILSILALVVCIVVIIVKNFGI